MSALGEWESFYVIVGSSAGAVIGLQFVVMTLIADKQVATSEALGSAFGTPNIVHFEDWLFHVLLPFAAYLTLIVSAFTTPAHLAETLFAIGAAALLLLFIGIHNAWDAVTYYIFVRKR